MTVNRTGKASFDLWAKDLSRDMAKQAMQMENQVIANIVRNDNIDTGTLVSNLERGSGDNFAWVESDTQPNPDHSGYAPALELGTYKSKAYPNFQDALETQEKRMDNFMDDYNWK